MTQFHPLPVVEVHRETADVVAVRLDVPAPLHSTFAYRPGQHVNVRAVVGDETLERTYSICSDPSEPGIRIAIKRITGGRFSTWANASLAPGMSLEVAPPSGRFVLSPSGGEPRHILAIAAGIGITPVIGVLRQALREEPASQVSLLYGNRTVEDIAFREELEGLKDRHLARMVLVQVLSRASDDESPVLGGRIDAVKIRTLAEPVLAAGQLTHAYLCGPGSLIREAREVLFDLGLPRERVLHEFFAPAGGGRAGPRAEPQPPPHAAEATSHGAEVTAVLDGVRYRFIARPGESIVDAALRSGVRVPFACKGGMCCTCRARLLDGSAEMHVNYSLEPWEREKGFILTCQAVAVSPRLVVDYDQM
jgi:ring-1,2-phenylacetyl-CoA epoxidase subunit PaaE